MIDETRQDSRKLDALGKSAELEVAPEAVEAGFSLDSNFVPEAVEADFEPDDFDEILSERLAKTYDSLEPSEEAEARMLAALKAAASETNLDEKRDERAAFETQRKPAKPRPRTDAPVRRKNPWLIGLPIAACLVVLAVFALGSLGTNHSDTSAMSQAQLEAAPKDAVSADTLAESADAYEAQKQTTNLATNAGSTAEAASSEGSSAEAILPDGTTLPLPLEGGRPIPADSSAADGAQNVGVVVIVSDNPEFDGVCDLFQTDAGQYLIRFDEDSDQLYLLG